MSAKKVELLGVHKFKFERPFVQAQTVLNTIYKLIFV